VKEVGSIFKSVMIFLNGFKGPVSRVCFQYSAPPGPITDDLGPF